MNLDMRVRDSTPFDALRLAALGMQVWLHTYATEGVSHDIATYVLTEFASAKMSALLSDHSKMVVVAETGECLAGYAVLHMDTVCPSYTKTTVELETLYIQTHFARQGFGTRLLARAEQIARQRADSVLWLTANAKNTPAISFYERHGYSKVGTTYFELGNTRHENHVFVGSCST